MANNGIYYSSVHTLNFTTTGTTWATLTSGGTFVIDTVSGGTYLNLPVSAVTSGTGISASTSNGIVTISNTSPDQTVTISGGTGITTGGTYPNFTITNSSPDQTVTITGGTNIQIAGSYPNFGVNFTGSTGSGGDYLPLSGGTVTGGTVFTNGVTANTISNLTYISFNTTATTSHVEGQIHWNDETKTLEIDTDKTGVTYEAGQNTLVRVTNQTGSALSAGTVVYINGAQGQRPTVTKASYELDQSSARTLGFVTANINDNNQGYVTTNGLLRNVDTNSYTAGTQLYLYTGGTVTNVRPIAPNHEVRLGYVITQNSTTGVIYVYVQNGYELEELHDVQITAKTNNDIIYWDNSAGVWKNTNSPVLTSLTAGTISATTYQNLPVSAVTNGTGISTSTTNGVSTITNTDLGSSQNIFKNIQIDGVTQFSAGSNSSNLNFSGINITITSASTNTLVFSAGTGSGGGVTSITAGSGLSGDTTTGAVTLVNTQVQGITGITAGNGITVSTINNVSTITNGIGIAVMTSDVDNTTTTLSSLTELTFSVVSGSTYRFRFVIHYDTLNTATGSRFTLSGAATTFLSYRSMYSLGAGTQTLNPALSAYDLPAASNTSSTAASGNIAIVEGILKVSEDGSVVGRFASEAPVPTAFVRAKAGSYVEYQKIA